MKLGTEHRKNGSHDLRIEAIDENDHAAQRRDQELILAEWLLVDEFADVEYGCLFQSGVNISETPGAVYGRPTLRTTSSKNGSDRNASFQAAVFTKISRLLRSSREASMYFIQVSRSPKTQCVFAKEIGETYALRAQTTQQEFVARQTRDQQRRKAMLSSTSKTRYWERGI